MYSHIDEIIEANGLGALEKISPIGGGSINEAYRIETNSNRLFLKLNDSGQFPKMFEAESSGLLLLSESDFAIPKPKIVGERGGMQFIIMEWIEPGSPKCDYWDDFGTALAKLHRLTSDRFGLDHDNYIGSLSQVNNNHMKWADFYRDERLIPQMKLAEKTGRLSKRMRSGFEALFNKLSHLFPTEKPALLHGDLWSGNMMVSSDGGPCIFDPAVYYGHREMDLAMMALFGGFGESWEGAYNDVYRLESGWQERTEIGQLYPLMVHVNLFGGGYARSVETILQKFT